MTAIAKAPIGLYHRRTRIEERHLDERFGDN
jgi:hypothetical protein